MKVSDEDWAIACEAIRGDNGFFGRKLERIVENEILNKTWALQDGYGEPGFEPPQGWDWSGIRDSSDDAKVKIVAEVKRILRKWNIEIPAEKVAEKVKKTQALREVLRTEMPELFAEEA